MIATMVLFRTDGDALAATGWGIWFTLMIVMWLAPWKPK